MRWAINAPDSAKLLLKDISTRKMNGRALALDFEEPGGCLDVGSSKEVSRACDRFFDKRQRMAEFHALQKEVRKQNEAA